jgi:hypothetical protein
MHERSLPCPKYYLVSLHTETDITGTGSKATADKPADRRVYLIAWIYLGEARFPRAGGAKPLRESAERE